MFAVASALCLLVLLLGASASRAAPDRGYEMVSHADMGGTWASFPLFRAGVSGSNAKSVQLPSSPDGERFVFGTQSPVPGTPATGASVHYVSERTPAGWAPTYVGAPGHLSTNAGLMDVSEDLSRVVLMATGELDDDDPSPERDLYAREPDGSLTWLSRTPPPLLETSTQHFGTAADGSVLFQKAPPSDDQQPYYVSGPAGPESAMIVDGVELTDEVDNSPSSGDPRISLHGRRVVFTASDPGGPSSEDYIWVRKLDEDETVVVNEPQLDPPTAQQDARVRSFSDDGSAVFFTTAQQLVAADSTDDRVDLYRFDVDAEQLELVSGAAAGMPAGSGDGDGCDPSSYSDETAPNPAGCDVSAVRFSGDGSTAYFISPEQLAPGADADVPNLYGWRDGVTRFVAELDPQDADTDTTNARSLRADVEGHQPARVTDDGTRLVFESRMETGDPDVAEIYIFDWDTGQVTCASCAALGSNADAQLRSPFQTHVPNFQVNSDTHGRNIANGGEQVYFQTAERLVEADTNGVMDVYEYDLASGGHALISSGSANNPRGSYYYDNSTDGQDVFFTSTETLVPPEQDLNSNVWKVYDARVGGGFAAVVAESPCGEGDCRGAPAQAPAFDLPASVGLAGGGDVRAQRIRMALARPGRRALRRAARTGRLVFKVRRNRPGVVRMRARARIGGRVRVVGRGGVRLRRRGVGRVRLRLSRPARRALVRGRALRVVVQVRSPGTRPRAMRLVLRRAGR